MAVAVTHCAGPEPKRGRRRTLCGIDMNDPARFPYCGAPRFVRYLAADQPHCPACTAALEDPPDPHLGTVQLRLPC